MNYIDEFGIIPTPSTIIFDQGRIHPVDKFNQVMEDINALAHHEGYLYPPMIYQEKGIRESYNALACKYSEYKVVLNSKRPSPVHYLPATHHLEVYEKYSDGGREQIGPFIIHLVGFLYGVRTQFHDWRIDGRALVKGRRDFYASPSSVGKCLTSSINTWSSWPDDEKMRMTNILYLYTKAISEEYEWLEFTLLYFVFDACYRLANIQHSVSANRHNCRLKEVASYFLIKEESELFDQWSRLRNDLFHEALWRETQVGTSTITSIYPSILYFHAFLSRVIIALLDYDTEYIRSSWRNLGKVCFD